MKTKLLALVMGVMIMASTQVAAHEISLFKDCGIGALIFNDDSGDRKLAAITNLVSFTFLDAGLLSSSSKLSNTCAGKGSEIAAALFIYETYDIVIEETAKGNGNHLTTVLDILGVSGSRDSIILNVQNRVLDAINATDYTSQSRLEKTEIYFNAINDSVI